MRVTLLPRTTAMLPQVTKSRKAKRSEEHTSELQSLRHLVCRLLLEKKKKINHMNAPRQLTALLHVSNVYDPISRFVLSFSRVRHWSGIVGSGLESLWVIT